MTCFSSPFPIIQAGMVWTSGAKLAAASANAGITGTIGAGSMPPELLASQIKKAKSLTSFHDRLAVNIPLLYGGAEKQLEIAMAEKIRIFITSAGSPKRFTALLKASGARVFHVVSNPQFAIKAEHAGVDAVIGEGFEAGGHNGRDEITTLTLIPQLLKSVSIPVIAAGGIATGQGLAAMLSLGAAGVQMGTRFLMTQESSAHDDLKQMLLKAEANSTKLCLKALTPVRLLENKFRSDIEALEAECASIEVLRKSLGKGRAKRGILEGDLVEGELEIGQICSLLKEIPSVADCVTKILREYEESVRKLSPRFLDK